ncbi:NADH dehydrogenase [ubiquinone] 1 alpha subcomplex assembly factor 3-like [Contarinia nasturtii]|uniref:NADH dehydrogenase [ubiquinone] 1 alpha subcomplex assembly factor 3-like n=1 Tax=Contarinia nasturtii TaxID=265458 RepID=UPI0012D3B63D|nr:NADH dehydrogenase [ubiquinone] 1 alpha subcomplex assembly factor 3-like [Contarinia nasturtii]
MKLLRSTFCLLNCNRNEMFQRINRFFSDSKINDKKPEVDLKEQNTKQIQEETTSERQIVSPEKTMESGIVISAYSTVGFRLNRVIKVIGPIIVFPKTVFSWHIESFDRLDSDSLMMFGLIQPRIETLIIGAGNYETSTSEMGKNILEISQKHKINVEVLTTELACTQFNYLNAEGRMIAAALIPPKDTLFGDDDNFQSLDFDNKLYSIDKTHSSANDLAQIFTGSKIN